MLKFLRHNPILRIAVPAIVSNITVPLLGLVDVALVGHLGAASYIGAIAVGGMIFSMIYWIFGFLRMGTSGMTSQAFGKQDKEEMHRMLWRALLTGLSLGLLMIAGQHLIAKLAFQLIHPSTEVAALALSYFRILIWGAPATLMLYGFTGWFIGLHNARFPMYIAIVQNLINIAVSLLLVYGFNYKVEGVAVGTLSAQYAGLLLAVVLWRQKYLQTTIKFDFSKIVERAAMRKFFGVNRDIFLRTLCLVAVTLYFTSAGAAQGDTILAVNTLLMQLFTLFSYFMDGFAYAGEALTGSHIGADNPRALRQTVNALFRWGVAIATAFIVIYALGETSFLQMLTNNETVIAAAHEYALWALAIPLVGFAAFLWDGVFVGATATRGMLLSMVVAALSFFICYFALRSVWGNHALWLSFILYLGLRGLIQTYWAKKHILS